MLRIDAKNRLVSENELEMQINPHTTYACCPKLHIITPCNDPLLARADAIRLVAEHNTPNCQGEVLTGKTLIGYHIPDI